MIRCIALDLDDSLLRSDLTMSNLDKAAIAKAISKGIKVLLASGRMVQSMKPYAVELGLDVPLIAYNGAIVQESVSQKTLYHCPVPSEAALRLLPIFQTAGVHLNAYINDQLYMEKLTVWGEKYAANARVAPHLVGDLSGLLERNSPHKMLGVGPKEKIDELQLKLQSGFGTSLQFVKSKPTYLEILAPGVSKGMALKELASGWGFGPEHVMAIGDAPNDLSMIIWAGIGVAMGNAAAEVRGQADLVIADHDHNGVAEAIDKVLL